MAIISEIENFFNLSPSSALQLEVTNAFTPGGAIANAVNHFLPRTGQTEMACAVAEAIENAQTLVVEASTGVGKTYAYLVPALLSGERVLLSTATKTLQDQLFGRDLPNLVKALGLPVRIALLKGRASYLCLHRLQVARLDTPFPEGVTLHQLARIEDWSHTTHSGDLAELAALHERSPIIPLVTSTRENCLGAKCPQFKPCHVNLARRDAMAADIVVINHHLFFADLAVRESGVAELLPSVRIAIFDEAHQLNETGVQFLGENLTTGQLLDFCRDLLACGLQLARGLEDWHQLAEAGALATRQLRLLAGDQFPGTKLRWLEQAPENIEAIQWIKGLQSISAALQKACVALDTVSEIAPDFGRLRERGSELVERIAIFIEPCAPGNVRWLEIGMQLRLIESPLDISKAVQTKMLKMPKEPLPDKANDERSTEPSNSLEASRKTWIFTSATLGDNDSLSWFTRPCGLTQAKIMRIGSPFDYARQAGLYIPESFPKPADMGHPTHIATATARWARQLGGRTLVLTTTLRVLRLVGEALKKDFENRANLYDPNPDLEILIQGQLPKRVLIERFRQGNKHPSGRGCILVASASFWEGIDVAGEALQLVVIDKLPFPPPGDPMAEARSRQLEAQGKSPFRDYFLPEAAVALKQGAGRLIRSETDEGVLVVCDTRLITMSYGARLIKALPAMERIGSEIALLARLEKLTRTCTRHRP